MAELTAPARTVPGGLRDGRLPLVAGAVLLALVAGYVTARASPTTVLAGAGSAAAVAGVMWRPALGALLYIVFVAVVPPEVLTGWEVRLGERSGAVQATDGLLALTMGAWLVHGLLRPREVRMPPPWVTVFIAAFLIAAVASLGTAQASGTSLKVGLSELRPLLGLLIVFPLLNGLRTVREAEVGLAVILAAAGISALEIVARYLLGIGGAATFTSDAIRVGGVPFLYPLLALVWAFVLLAYPARVGTRLSLLGLAAISSGALIVTFQRGAWVAALLTLPFGLLLLRRGRRTRAMMFGATFAVTAAIFFLTFNTFSVAGSADPLRATADRFISLSSINEDASGGHRIAEWEEAFRRIRESPVTGIGLGTSITFFSPLYSPVTEQKGNIVSSTYVHSSYIWAPLKLGIPGALAFFLLVGAVVTNALRAYRRARSARTERLAVGALATLAAVILTAVSGPELNTPGAISYLAAVIAGIHCIRQLENAEPPAPRA